MSDTRCRGVCRELWAITAIAFLWPLFGWVDAAGQWPTRRMLVDSVGLGGYGPDRKLDMASTPDGKWHLVYWDRPPENTYTDHIFYFNSDGITDTVARTRVGLPSIASDASGNLHLAYQKQSDYGPDDDTLMYLDGSPGAWGAPQPVATYDQRTYGVEGADLSIDANGNWHVIYQTLGENDMTYLMWASSGFDTAIAIDSLPSKWLGHSAIACDHNPPYHIHIAYYDCGGCVRYRRYGSDGLIEKTLLTYNASCSSVAYLVYNVDIAVDALGKWHMVYTYNCSGPKQRTKILYRTEDTHPVTLASTGTTNQTFEMPGLTVDADQHVHVAYYVMTPSKLVDMEPRYIEYQSTKPEVSVRIAEARTKKRLEMEPLSNYDMLGRRIETIGRNHAGVYFSAGRGTRSAMRIVKLREME